MDDAVKFAMIESMKKYGGGFVQALAECFVRADASNFARLLFAFPEYVEEYLVKAGIDKMIGSSIELTDSIKDPNLERFKNYLLDLGKDRPEEFRD